MPSESCCLPKSATRHNKAYSNEGYYLANDVSIVSDGYYIVGSGSYSYTNLISSLVKLDSMGCLVPGCDTITEVGIQPIEAIGPQVTVYPNPASSKATVLLNHGKPNSEVVFTLYSISGQVVATEKHQLNHYGFGEWNVNLEGLQPGTYLYRIDGDRCLKEGKLIVN